MRLVLIAFEQNLGLCLQALNLVESDLRAVITVRTNTTNKIIQENNFLQGRIFPYEVLKECVNNCYFDYILVCGYEDMVMEDLKKMGVNKEQIIDLRLLPFPRLLNISRLMRKYYVEAEKYKTFITGLSYAHYGFDLNKFTLPAINFSVDSQDLYYGYKLAAKALEAANSAFKYGIINLHPYSFHYDLSRTRDKFLVLAYALLLQDTHNYWIRYVDMQKILNESFLSINPSIDGIDVNDINNNKKMMNHPIQIIDALKARNRAEEWKYKRYPETVEENKQILLQYVRMCQSRNIEPLLVVLPCTDIYRKYFPMQLLEEFYYIIHEVQKKTGARFLDYFALNGFDYSNFRDCDHLNVSGSIKMTEIMDKEIMRLEERLL